MSVKTKRLYIFSLISCIICWITLCSTSALAENNLVPYDPGSQSQTQITAPEQSTNSQSSSQKEDSKDYAGEIFKDIEFSEDPTVREAVSSVATVLSWIITLVIGVMPYLMSILMVIDVVCILIKPVNTLLAGLPIQLFSDTVIEINGIQFVGAGEGNKGSTNVEKKDLKGQSGFIYYLKNKIPNIVIAITLFLLLHTGILFNVIFFIANKIVGWIDGLV